MRNGRVTIPTNVGYEKETKEIAEKWGADAVRDCDGTSLPPNANELAGKVYNTYFVVRGDNAWADAHPNEWQNVLLMSGRVIARSETCKIELLKGYYRQQLAVNPCEHKKFWQVFDRTENKEIKTWEFDGKGGVIISSAKPYHEYTVNFFALNIWDSTQMYNYITNSWTGEKHKVMEPRYPATWEHIKHNLEEWCENNPDVNVVRFTTFLYHFFLVFNEEGKEKHVDWFGYPMTASPLAFKGFAAEYGYEITTEDIVCGGLYGNPFSVPSKKLFDYMDYIQRYVSGAVRELTDITHRYGKQAMMFLGDSWIGCEPYGKYFKNMNIDAVVGSVGGGVTVRMLSEIPHVKYREGRLLPYFFPDTFFDGNEENAVSELNRNWVTARRALMRKPLDRIGFGGYLSLAAKFPKFVNRVAEICDEFRAVVSAAFGGKPYVGASVAILGSWGELRSWQNHMVAHELRYRQIYSMQGVFEALSGLAVGVKFISFADVRKNGIPGDIDVIICAGAEGTAWSGGTEWDAEAVCAVRKWVDEGHGFIGVGEPTAKRDGAKTFALADVLGVDCEKGFSLSEDKYNITPAKEHFITKDVLGDVDYGEDTKNIYALGGAEVLDIKFARGFERNANAGEVKLAVNNYGAGRGVYIAGLPYCEQNARLLYRAIYFAAHKESELNKAFSSNPATECNYYPECGKYAIINNTAKTQQTVFYDISGAHRNLTLAPNAVEWVE